jgi:hypothetical protein
LEVDSPASLTQRLPALRGTSNTEEGCQRANLYVAKYR